MKTHYFSDSTGRKSGYAKSLNFHAKKYLLLFCLFFGLSESYSQDVYPLSLDFGTVVQNSVAPLQGFYIINMNGDLSFTYKQDCGKCYKIKYAGRKNILESFEVTYNTKIAGPINHDITINIANYGTRIVHLSGNVTPLKQAVSSNENKGMEAKNMKENCMLWDCNDKRFIDVHWNGECKDGYANGKGKASWSGGNAKGYAVNGKFEGYTVFDFSYIKYEGSFKNGVPDGHCVVTRKDNGQIITGEYKNGSVNGKAVYFNGKDSYFSCSNIVNGKPNGLGYLNQGGKITKMYCNDGECSSESYNNSEASIANQVLGVAIATALIAGGVKAMCNYYREAAASESYSGSSSYSGGYSSSSGSAKASSSAASDPPDMDIHDTRIDDVVSSDGKYIVKFQNGGSLEVKIEFKSGKDYYDVYCVKWKDNGGEKCHEVYLVTKEVAQLGGMTGINNWYASTSTVLNGTFLGVKGKDDEKVVKYFVKGYYLR
ncbi:MAG: hypothetical protein NTU98_04940 [Bacteroidetes bacterium]|nr:hypothetical protein [Bacteroidota bacterium]